MQIKDSRIVIQSDSTKTKIRSILGSESIVEIKRKCQQPNYSGFHGGNILGRMKPLLKFGFI